MKDKVGTLLSLSASIHHIPEGQEVNLLTPLEPDMV